jgi:hypothetical protein
MQNRELSYLTTKFMYIKHLTKLPNLAHTLKKSIFATIPNTTNYE